MALRGRPRAFDRDAALRRAMEVFWAKGYERTSLADLTEAMGINSPSLYAAFTSKEALFQEALALYSTTEGSEIWEGVPVAPTARAACAHLLRATAEAFASDDKRRGCMAVLSAPQMDGASPSICDTLKHRRAATTTVLRERLRRAVAEGDLPATADVEAITAYMVTVQHGLSIQARDGVSRETLLAIADCAMAGWENLASAGGTAVSEAASGNPSGT